ncbi:DUF4136 domain-containing protein [Dyadobacter sp. CY345]|uniref:DUF4136 domain-containing protein n=1 Tax=Dyadobacter sp. CY345 TaxID=2909335 RepID=UPI001F475862|nr:DUF4136 domain-containing protein [Dyadobacter sp. CY345]MCF2446176.1 DUF4136 domain-containing protein [Dyadobacter sp. CY345]
MKTSILFIILVSTFFSCAPSHKILKPDKEDNFRLSDYTTYGFFDVEAKGDTTPATFDKNITLIKDAISKNLEAKGLNQAQDPTLKVNIAISVKQEIQTRQTNFLNDGRPLYMGQRRYSWKSKEVETGRYKEGTLLIDLVDASSNKMVWKGGAEGILPGKEEKFAEEINKVVTDILASTQM